MFSSCGKTDLGLCALIAGLSALAFCQAAGHEFVNWDDLEIYVKNSWLMHPTSASFLAIWSDVKIGSYCPVAWALLLIESVLFGLDARVVHVTSLALHAVNGVLLYGLCLDLDRVASRAEKPPGLERKLGAAIAVLWVMLHPLKVEAVAWASGQVYLLAAFWTVLAVWIYVRSIDDSGSSRVPGRMLAAAFYLCSILSKAVGFGLPLVLLMLDYYPLRRHKKRPPRELWLEKLPFFGISALGVGISIWARGHEHDLHSLAQLGIWDRAARVGTSLSIYARHLLEFSSLSPFYPELPLPAPLTATAVMGLVGGSILLLGAFLLRRSIPSLLVSWVACLLFLAPHLGFVPTGRVAAADRYTYLASLALAPVIAQGVIAVMAAGLRRRAAVVAIGGLVTAVLASATFRQVGHWRNSVTLWQRALAVAEEKTAELYFNVARSLQIAGRTGEAVEMLKESLRVDPEYKNSLLNLSAIHLAERRHAEAVSPLEQLLRLYPQEAAAHSNLGLALAGVGRLRDAESHFLEAVELDPGRPDFAANLARFYLHVGQAEAGLSALLRFKASGKREMAVDLLTAKALIRSGRVERARAELDESVAFWDGRGTPTIGLRCLRSAAQTGALEDIDQCR